MLNEAAFRKYLAKNMIGEPEAKSYVKHLKELQGYLKPGDIDTMAKGTILQYTKHLVAKEKNTVLDVLRALIHYGTFTEKHDYIAEILDVAEAYYAMDTLYQRVEEHCGITVRDAVFKDITIPPLGVDPEPKAEVTKLVMRRLEDSIGEDATIALLAPCLHGREVEPALQDHEDLLRLKDIDAFLALKREEMLERIRHHQQEGTLEFAQYVDADVVAYIEQTPTVSPGIREGTRIINTKIPYQLKQMLTADTDQMKRYHICYCPWVRGAIKNGTEHEISANFCHCSAGFTMKYWEIVFDQPVTVQPIETALTGALHCKFAVDIPKEYQKSDK
ncbi:MAG: hypothetical protein Q6361_07035 [Candidatus Hermodarchaeota archaeon]|nr:hypothetical protein [Candidatus Hermodarchaeota archaeon]